MRQFANLFIIVGLYHALLSCWRLFTSRQYHCVLSGPYCICTWAYVWNWYIALFICNWSWCYTSLCISSLEVVAFVHCSHNCSILEFALSSIWFWRSNIFCLFASALSAVLHTHVLCVLVLFSWWQVVQTLLSSLCTCFHLVVALDLVSFFETVAYCSTSILVLTSSLWTLSCDLSYL